MAPLGAAQESPCIKTELQEPHPEEALQVDKAQGAWSWDLSQGAKEKALFLPGGEERGEEQCFPSAAVRREGGSPPRRGGEEAAAMVRSDAWVSAHLPLGGHPGTASEPTALFLGGVSSVHFPGMSPLGEQQDAAG